MRFFLILWAAPASLFPRLFCSLCSFCPSDATFTVDVGNQGMVVKGWAFRNAVCCLGNASSLGFLDSQQSVGSGTICWMKSRTASEATRLGAPSRSQDCSDSAPSPLHRKVLYSLNPQVSPGDQRLATWPLWITGRVEAMSFLTARGRGPAEWGLEEVPPLN